MGKIPPPAPVQNSEPTPAAPVLSDAEAAAAGEPPVVTPAERDAAIVAAYEVHVRASGIPYLEREVATIAGQLRQRVVNRLLDELRDDMVDVDQAALEAADELDEEPPDADRPGAQPPQPRKPGDAPPAGV